MYDPALQIDPFVLYAVPRAHCGCQAVPQGRLFIERVSEELRSVWCDECKFTQLFDRAGRRSIDPGAAAPRRDTALQSCASRRQWNSHPESPSHQAPAPNPQASPAPRIKGDTTVERTTKTCPKCNQQVKMLRKATGWCHACSHAAEGDSVGRGAGRKPARRSARPVEAAGIGSGGEQETGRKIVDLLLQRSRRLAELACEVAQAMGVEADDEVA